MNTFGTLFRVSVFGESHGPAIGAVVDGCPAGIALEPGDFEADLSRRRPGAPGTTPRREADALEILSGIHAGRTTGSPIAFLTRNSDAESGDYAEFATRPRPGHADFVARAKYSGHADMRGSGHFSGRITFALVAAGVIAKKTLPDAIFSSCLLEAGGAIAGQDSPSITDAVKAASEDGDSVGGIVECRCAGLPPGLGEPFFEGAESLVSAILFSIPGIRGVEFGDGFAAARMRGSEHNDPIVDATGRTSRNGSGGFNGGITNGNEIVLRLAVKPTSSIAREQSTWDYASGAVRALSCPGRHDSCFALRVPVVAEAALAIAMADLYLRKNRYERGYA